MAAMSRFPPVTAYDASARERRTAASDLDGTLLASSSAFPYYFLVALEAGGYLRALALLLLAPFILLLYTAVSEPAAIGLLVFATFAGLRVPDVEAVARGVLPRHYAAGVRADSWEVFKACGAGRRVVVTASPAVMVAPFVREFLGAEVAGTELGTCCGRFTGKISGGALVADRKREVVQRLFAGGDMPDVRLGDRDSDHDFMAVCKEAWGRPLDGYKVTFLPALRPEETCGGGGWSAVDVANHVQAVIAKELGYRCTTLTRKDKYMKLAGNDGRVVAAAGGEDDGKKFV